MYEISLNFWLSDTEGCLEALNTRITNTGLSEKKFYLQWTKFFRREVISDRKEKEISN